MLDVIVPLKMFIDVNSKQLYCRTRNECVVFNCDIFLLDLIIIIIIIVNNNKNNNKKKIFIAPIQ